MSESPYAAKPWLRNYDFWAPETIRFPRQSVYQILMLAAAHFSHRTATIFEGAELSFWEIKRRADLLATALGRLGMAPGDRVGLMLPNCPQYGIGFFAILRAGAIVTNLNPTYTPAEVTRVALDSGMRAIITLETIAPAVQQIQSQTAIEHVILTRLAEYSAEQAAPPNLPGALALSSLIAAAGEPDLPRLRVDAMEDTAVLQYTGGTTGTPKAAMLTHYNLYANTLQSALWNHYLTRRGEERILLVLPCFHVYGMVVGLLLSLWNGSAQILLPSYNADRLVDAIRRHRPTFFPAVPTLFIALLNHPESRSCGLEHVGRFNSGAAPLPVEVIEKFEKLTGGFLREGYGLTESTCTAASTPVLAPRKPGSVGLPVTGTEFRVVDLDSGEKESPTGEEGELCIRGPQVMKGYWNNLAETAHAIRDGWLYTGDIGRMDADGYFYIVQRKKDMINVGGMKVFPNEVEEVLFAHPAVMEAAAIGLPHEYRGEIVKAFVVAKAGAQVRAEELIEFCRASLAKFKVPAEIEFTASLPKSTVGKVLRRELREREAARRRS